MAKITPDDRVLKRGSLPFFCLIDTDHFEAIE